MKVNEVSSNRRSKTEVEVRAQDRSGFEPSAASTIRRGARRSHLVHASRQRTKSHAGGAAPLIKDVKNEGRSGNVYENKGPDDNLPDIKGDICARLHAILHRKARILQKPSALLPLFERWKANHSLQNVETPATGRIPVPYSGRSLRLHSEAGRYIFPVDRNLETELVVNILWKCGRCLWGTQSLAPPHGGRR
jgi:hypothetical protein